MFCLSPLSVLRLVIDINLQSTKVNLKKNIKLSLEITDDNSFVINILWNVITKVRDFASNSYNENMVLIICGS